MPLTADIILGVSATLTNVLDLVTATAPLNLKTSVSLTNGTGANKAQKVFSDRRTLASGANENLDLAGALTDAFGATLTFADIKAIYLSALSTNTTTVTLTAPATNGYVGLFAALGDGLNIPPGGAVLLVAPGADGWGVVVAGTGDLLNVANAAGASATYDIVIIGE
ncbi:MAG TPA: hypothetical protein VNP04_15525 [Alphaproteobacteria bacterium]|nr:hypothetical protein [Alphaproteobacteria bacterium]